MVRLRDALETLQDDEDGDAITVPFSLSVQDVPCGTLVKEYSMVDSSPERRRDGVAVTVRSALAGQLVPTVTGVQDADALWPPLVTDTLAAYWPFAAYVVVYELLVEVCEDGVPNELVHAYVGVPLNPLMLAVHVIGEPMAAVEGDGVQLAETDPL